MAVHTIVSVSDLKFARRAAIALLDAEIAFTFGPRESNGMYEINVVEKHVEEALAHIRNVDSSCDECCAGPCAGPRMDLCRRQNKV